MPPLSSSVSDPVLETRIFWDRYTKEIVAAVLAAFLAIAGFGGYRYYQARRDSAAAELLAGAKKSADFEKVITQYSGTPASASAYLFLAEEERKEKRYEAANVTLESFIDKNPKHQLKGTARMAMAANLESLGKRDE
ncbi:MAG TPA: tetratricopeptide repeat protein, partial [Chthoniobacterales bacterium]